MVTAEIRDSERALEANMTVLMRRKGITVSEMAERMGMSPSTLYNRRLRPGTFTVSEINKAAEILMVDTAELFKTT